MIQISKTKCCLNKWWAQKQLLRLFCFALLFACVQIYEKNRTVSKSWFLYLNKSANHITVKKVQQIVCFEHTHTFILMDGEHKPKCEENTRMNRSNRCERKMRQSKPITRFSTINKIEFAFYKMIGQTQSMNQRSFFTAVVAITTRFLSCWTWDGFQTVIFVLVISSLTYSLGEVLIINRSFIKMP